jgi:polyribonucleotide nucleotidyltransferase
MNKINKIDEVLKYNVRIGDFAGQANGAVWLQKGDTVVLSAVTSEKSSDFPGFLPLTVDYREQFAAAGKIPGGYFKREGKPSDKEVLQGRLIDRSIRPLFPNNFFDKVSVVSTLYSIDEENLQYELLIVSTSLALCLSRCNFLFPIGGCQLARFNNEWIVNPSQDILSKAESRFFVSGTEDGINMVEGSSFGIKECDLIDGLFIAYEEIKKQIEWQKKIIKEFFDVEFENKNEDFFNIEFWKSLAKSFLSEARILSLFIADKLKRDNKLDDVWKEFLAINAEKIKSEQINESIVKYAYDFVLKELLSSEITNKKKRIDGRDFETVRDISIEVGLLPRNHGSAMFKRGRTQLLNSVTLGGLDDALKIDALLDEPNSQFMLHYNFPSFSVGEVKANRGPSKRDVGHGYLAANAIRAVLPEKDKFPYTIRIVADVLESDGSSSQATICASTMALLDAGVPIKDLVAGVAMGMLRDKSGNFNVITDIAGIEDEFGLMDFKIAGTKSLITAVQMDIKHKGGLGREIFESAFENARKSRLHILSKMELVLASPRKELAKTVPRFEVINIPKEKIGAVIGSGGKVIKEITEKTGTSINIKDDGTVHVFGVPGDGLNKAISWIKVIAGSLTINTKLSGVIKKRVEFGFFVELFPGIDGLIHISTLDRNFESKKPISEGDKVNVIVIDYDNTMGRIRLKIVNE